MSVVVQFKTLSSSMIDLLDTFDGLCDKVLIEYNDKARDLTKLCYNLHKEFYDQMCNVSSVCNESSNSIRNILLELTVATRTQSGEINSKILNTQENVGRAQTQLNKDRPNTKLLDQLCNSETLAFLGSVPGANSNIFFVLGQAIVGAVAIAINGVNRLINRRKIKRYDAIANVLNELSHKLRDLLEVSFKFHQSLDKTLTNLENYTILADKLVRFSNSKKHSTRLLIMAEDMLPDTKVLQKDFQDIREQALVNSSDLEKVLVRFNPRGLIGN